MRDPNSLRRLRSVPRAVTWGTRVAWLAAAFVLPASFAACGSPPVDDSAAGNGGGTGTAANGSPDSCELHGPGCPCTSPGLITSCGEVSRRSGDYVTCSPGTQTCGSDGMWGACIGDGVASQTFQVGGNVHPAGLASTPVACATNNCDPSCVTYNDVPNSTLDAGAGFAVNDAGLTLSMVDAGAMTACTGLTPISDVNLTVTQINPTVTSPATSLFTASLIPSGCASALVAPVWGVSRYDLAVISLAGTYTQVVPRPGDVTVTGYLGSFTQSATVHVKVNATDTSAAPSGYTAASFTTTPNSTEAAPSVLYPYDNVVLPLGLSAPLFMWQSATTSVAKAVRIGLRFPAGSSAPTFLWSAIVSEASRGSQRFQIPQTVWSAFDQTSAGAQGQIEIQRIDSTNKLQAPVVVRTNLTNANLRGRIVYTQYAGGSVGSVLSVLPYGSSPPVTRYTTPLPNGWTNCGVCHSMSADGSKFISSSDDSTYTTGRNPYAMSNVAGDGTFTALNFGPVSGGDSRGLSFSSLTRNGSYALLGNNWWGNVNGGSNATTPGSAGPKFKVYQLPTAAAGNATDVSDSGFGGTGNVWGLSSAQMYTPVFSPDNTRLLFGSADTTAGAAARQGIGYWSFDETNKKFSGRTQIVKTNAGGSPANKYLRWPAWENDSRSILFQTADATTSDDDGFDAYAGMNPSGCCGRIKVHGQMWSVDSGPTGGAATTPVALGNLNKGLGATSPLGTDDTNRSYQPTMLNLAVGGYRWAVFTSVRTYGNLVNNSTTALNTANGPFHDKLWVAAIDDATSGTTDRSHPPFFLPNQDLTTSTLNERGYWSLDACLAPDLAASSCSSNDQCCGYDATPATASCAVDTPISATPTFHCKSTQSAVCSPMGAACLASIQCCNYPNGPLCISGTCQTPPPVYTYNGATYTRDYSATCNPTQSVAWHFFDWETLFPTATGASLVFGVSTAATQAGLPAAPQAHLGTQTVTNATWIGADVDAALTGATPARTPSSWIRVYMQFNPSTDMTGTPTLTDWRQAYDCVDSM